MSIQFTVRPLVECVLSVPDLDNIPTSGCYRGYGRLMLEGVSAGAILGALNSDTSSEIKKPHRSMNYSNYLKDSGGYVKVPRPSAVVVCLRKDVDVVVSEVFRLVNPVSITLFPSVAALTSYYSGLDRDMLTQKRVGYLIQNSKDASEFGTIKSVKDLESVPAPKALKKTAELIKEAHHMSGEATVALVLNAPVLVGGHYKVYEKLWIGNSDKVGNEPDFYEGDTLVGELYQSCTKPESIMADGCVKCFSSSLCIPKLLSEQGTGNVINKDFVWIDASNSEIAENIPKSLLLAEEANCKEVTEALKMSNLLSYVKPYLARSEDSLLEKRLLASITTCDLDLSRPNLDKRLEDRREAKAKADKANTKRREHCSKCSLLDGCRPYGNKENDTRFYSRHQCVGPINKYSPKEEILNSVLEEIVKSKYLYKIICTYSGAQLFYQVTSGRRGPARSFKGAMASIGHITSERVLPLLDLPYIYFDRNSKVEVTNNTSTTKQYSFSGYKISEGRDIPSTKILNTNSFGITNSLYKAIVRTGLLKMYELPYEIDKKLEGWVARLIIEDTDYYTVAGRASIAIYVPLQVALLGLGNITSFPGMTNPLALTPETQTAADGDITRDYREHMKRLRNPVLDRKAASLYVKAYDVVEYPEWVIGGFSSAKARVYSNVACSIKAGTGMLNLTQHSWRIFSSEEVSASGGKSLETYMPRVVSVFEGVTKDSSIPYSSQENSSKNMHWYSIRRAHLLAACLGSTLSLRSAGYKNYVYRRANSGVSGYIYKKVRLVELCKETFYGDIHADQVHNMAKALVSHYGLHLISRFVELNFLKDTKNPAQILAEYTGKNMDRDTSQENIVELGFDEAVTYVVSVLMKCFLSRGIEVNIPSPVKRDSDPTSVIAEKILGGQGTTSTELNSRVSVVLPKSKRRTARLFGLSAKDSAIVDPAQILYSSVFNLCPLAKDGRLGGMNLLKTCNRDRLDCYTGSEESLNVIKSISRAISKYKTESLALGFGIRRDSYYKVLSSILDNIRRSNANNS